MRKPFPHQLEAIEATLKTFKKHDRCHIVMACGTGKTFTAFNITKQLKPENVTIFVPSLALINQFLKSWAQCIKDPHKILVICSDKHVLDSDDDEAFLTTELDYPVTSEPGEIRTFIKSKIPHFKIIFCTYQSANLLGQALNGDKLLDFAIYDEAHKTAGYEKTTFSYALHDENIHFNRRLFMTATPRHGKPKIKVTGEEATLFSMDDKSIYGPRAYTLPFREAINRGLICNYKIIISCIAKDTAHKFNQEYEFQEKTESLKEAIRKSGAKKIITFHSSIAHAKNFTNFLKKHKVHDNQLHVNADLGMAIRHDVMNKFKINDKSIISNSKCLTEGVDVPSVDMVAFLNPKSSKIDIVQAIGRALRNAPGKKYGYIFLPLLVTNPDKLEEEIQGSEFKAIWEVLNALMEQDSELADSVKFLSRNPGGIGTGKPDPLETFFSFGRNKVSKEVKKLIKVKILHKLLPAWDIMYERLADHYYATGTTYLSVKHPDKELRRWCQRQREAKNTLSEERTNLLDEINFIWVVKEQGKMVSWDDSYENLKAHFKKFGLPPTFSADKKLYNWINTQRVYFNQNKLSKEKSDKLIAAGVVLEKYVTRSQILQPNTTTSNRVVINYNLAWQYKFEELKKYKAQFGTTHVPQRGEYQKLGKWVCCQREDYKAGKMTTTRKDLLKSIGFIFEMGQNLWETRLNEFAQNPAVKSEALKNWITYQREQFRIGKMSPQKIEQLKAVNFNFNYAAGRFSYAHDPITAHPKWKPLIEKYKKLNTWVSGKRDPLYDFLKHIRENYRAGKLNEESIRIMNSYNFVWNPEGGQFKKATA